MTGTEAETIELAETTDATHVPMRLYRKSESMRAELWDQIEESEGIRAGLWGGNAALAAENARLRAENAALRHLMKSIAALAATGAENGKP